MRQPQPVSEERRKWFQDHPRPPGYKQLGFAGVVLGVLPFLVLNESMNVDANQSGVMVIMTVFVAVAWCGHLWLLRIISAAFQERQGRVLSSITRV